MFRVDLFSYFFLCFSVLFSVSGFISVCFSARALHGEFLEKSVQLFPENNGVPKRKASKSTFQDHWEKLKLSSEMERVLNDAHEPIHLRGFGEFDEEELREIISEKASNLPSWGVYNLVELTKLKIVLSNEIGARIKNEKRDKLTNLYLLMLAELTELGKLLLVPEHGEYLGFYPPQIRSLISEKLKSLKKNSFMGIMLQADDHLINRELISGMNAMEDSLAGDFPFVSYPDKDPSELIILEQVVRQKT